MTIKINDSTIKIDEMKMRIDEFATKISEITMVTDERTIKINETTIKIDEVTIKNQWNAAIAQHTLSLSLKLLAYRSSWTWGPKHYKQSNSKAIKITGHVFPCKMVARS